MRRVQALHPLQHILDRVAVLREHLQCGQLKVTDRILDHVTIAVAEVLSLDDDIQGDLLQPVGIGHGAVNRHGRHREDQNFLVAFTDHRDLRVLAHQLDDGIPRITVTDIGHDHGDRG
ncbi:hypothetical protein D3C76_481200 [compost metagenome]